MQSILLLIATLGQAPALPVTPNWALLTHPTVQSALQLSDPQTRAIFTIRSAANVVMKRLARKHSKSPTGDTTLAALEKLGKSLPMDKQARLAQITLQEYGPKVIQAPGIGKALGLSAADVDRITKAQEAAAAPFDEKIRAYTAAHPSSTSIVQSGMVLPVETPAIRKLNDERDAKLTGLLKQSLTPEQNARLVALLGKPVKLS